MRLIPLPHCCDNAAQMMDGGILDADRSSPASR
jgi:hypothetical protein